MLCISDFMCLCCNWEPHTIASVVLIWYFIVCRVGELSAIVCVEVELTKLWFWSQSKLLMGKREVTIDAVFNSWKDFTSKITTSEMKECLDRLTVETREQRAVISLEKLRLMNPLYN